MKFYDPYPKQKAFHEAGHDKAFRLFMAGNQLGKSVCGGAECAMHVTGLYPNWWEGKRFEHPIIAWCGGDTNVTTRDILQAKLFGEEGETGTGFIPPDCIGRSTPSRNISDGIDKIQIKHSSGGWSTIVFKSYQQGRRKWQGKSVHLIWLDEEPEEDIWSEAVARITATNGMIMLTFTPLEGLSTVVRQFYPFPKHEEMFLVRMTLDQAQHEDGRSHLTPEMREKQLSRFPEHQRDARLRGLPILGSGLVYLENPGTEALIIEQPVKCGRHWRHIIGLDMGGASSPTAWAHLALDPEVDVVHLIHCYKHIDPRISVHASAIMAGNGRHIPVAWPHDVNIHSSGDGITYREMYAKHGVRMLPQSARFPDVLGKPVPYRVEPGVQMILDRMLEGRFKASLNLQYFWEEVRMYHRLAGIINKIDDHLMDAIRMAIMMLRFARPIQDVGLPTRVTEVYNPLGQQRAVFTPGLPTKVYH